MLARKNENGIGQSSTLINESKPLKYMEPEITIQDPSKSLERVHTTPEASSMERENRSVIIERENPFADAEVYLMSTLNELEKLYDMSYETKAIEVKMR
jgi:hypothetical protein